MSIDLDKAQQNVLKRLGPYVGDAENPHIRGVMNQLQPLRQFVFNKMVREEARDGISDVN